MSFLKISDLTKREANVKEILDLKNRIKDSFRKERTGEIEMQSDLTKFFKPITETQKAAAKEITEELKPIKEGIENLPKAIMFPTFPTITATSEPTEREDVQYIDATARQYLMRYATKKEADTTFGITSKGNEFYMGDRNIKIKGNDIEVLDNDGNVDEKYEGTPGLWELIVLQKPKNYTDGDKVNYKNLLFKTNAVYRDNNPNSNDPAGNRKGYKWENVVKPIWNNRKQYGGKGIVIIPEDPNALLERLDHLLASQEAGHKGIGNELVSICDELKRQEVIDADTYKKLNSYIKI